MDKKRINLTLIAVMFIFIAASMRAPMGSVGPLIGLIRTDLGINSAVAGFMTTIPLLIFALTAPIAGRIAARINTRTVLYGCMATIVAGMLIRSYCGAFGLFAGTALLGLGIGILNVLMPALIRNQFAKIGLMMGIYTAAMTGASAIAAGAGQQLALSLGSWRNSMAVFAVFPIIALVFCFSLREQISSRFQATERQGRPSRIFTRKNISIAVYLGLQSLLFFSLITWLPSIARAAMPDYENTGLLVLGMQVLGLIPALLVPTLIGKIQRRGLFVCLTTLLFSVGFFAVLMWGASLWAIILSTVCFGLAVGATMGIALTLIAMQGQTAAETARGSAFIQCISYCIAAFGPTGAGLIFDLTDDWKIVLIILFVLSITMSAVGGYAGKNKASVC